MNIDIFLKDLENKLDTHWNSKVGREDYHKDSIMKFGKVCNCDDAFMCSHRREYLINYMRVSLRTLKLEELTK